jgi:hypothetical protein
MNAAAGLIPQLLLLWTAAGVLQAAAGVQLVLAAMAVSSALNAALGLPPRPCISPGSLTVVQPPRQLLHWQA